MRRAKQTRTRAPARRLSMVACATKAITGILLACATSGLGAAVRQQPGVVFNAENWRVGIGIPGSKLVFKLDF